MYLPNLYALSNDFDKIEGFKNPRTLVSYHVDTRKCWAHIVTKESNPKLYGILEECAAVLKPEKIPKLIIYKSRNNYSEASALGDSIYLSVAALRLDNKNGLRWTIGYEMGHEGGYKARKRPNLIRNATKSYVAAFASAEGAQMLAGSHHPAPKAVVQFAGLLFSVLFVRDMRREEYKADQAGIDVVKDPEIFEETLRRSYEKDKPIYPAGLSTVMKILDTPLIHPSDKSRVAAAKKYAREQGYISDEPQSPQR